MRILLVYANRNRFLAPLPVGIAYLIPPLKAKGHQVRVLDLMYSNNPDKDLRRAINDFRPDAAGFSIRNSDNQNMLAPDDPLPAVREYIRLAKKNGIKTIVGGKPFSILPEVMLSYLEADYGIAGQGEDSLPLLLDMIEDKTIDPSIPGLVWRERETVCSNQAVNSGYARKHPDWSMIDAGKYNRMTFPTPVVIKTGCQFDCMYCDTCRAAGNSMMPRDIDSIIRDIRDIVDTIGTRKIFFSDPCLANPPGFAKELFRAIIREKLRISFYSNLEPARGCYDEELLELCKRAGGVITILGCDSLSPVMLRSYKKPFGLDDILQWSGLAKKTGLLFWISLLFGGPGENEATVRESLEVLPEIGFALFMYGIGIRIYPGTGLFDIAKKEGVVRSEEELIFPRFYASRELDVKKAKKRIDRTALRYSTRLMKALPIVPGMLFDR